MIEKAKLCPQCLLKGKRVRLVYYVFLSGYGFLICRECKACLPKCASEQEALSANLKLVEALEKGGEVITDERFLCPYCLIKGHHKKMAWAERHCDSPPQEWLICYHCLSSSPRFASRELVLEANGKLVEAAERWLREKGEKQ